MAAVSSQRTLDDMQPDFTSGRVFDKVFAEGMALVERTASYLDGPGREMSRKLPREAGLTYAAWSMELTARLMQAASWLVMQRAVRDGDMSREDALSPKYRLRREAPALEASEQRGLGLPDAFLDLVENSEALYNRICRLDEAIYQSGTEAHEGPVNRQIEALKAAAQQGAFDPLKIWGGTR
jgi:regulator of CtrA degradation